MLGFLLGGCILTETLTNRGPLMSYFVGIAAGAFAGTVMGEVMSTRCRESSGGDLNVVREGGVFANGRWIHIRGGPARSGEVRVQPMVISRSPGMDEGGEEDDS